MPSHSAALARGFTLLELMIVVALAALVSAGVAFSLRDSSSTQLEREAVRLAALLDTARAQSRTSGVPIVWRATPRGYEFLGAGPRADRAESLAEPRDWLAAGTQAHIVEPADAPGLVLGPEPMGPPQRLVLSLGERRLVLASNGLRPFATDAGQ
jgi:general secretion pathway protein H